ncbi:autotransporter assembly complex protein TamA [Marinivivus vitaminiproducens]|uniref:autotransporter assembly complex protein TamA n=1 Tax=Marinivivus vitaminiproducens TaxID=3035935 RepID=UPI0027AAD5C8|nr:BamA/TamA family outer membrane protein [Geminicoccaceae bacterium SCSIO 64248]
MTPLPRARRRRAAGWMVLPCLMLSACSGGEESSLAQDIDADASASERGGGIAYTVDLRGVADESLAGLLRSVASTERQIEQPPSTITVLRNRADTDVQTMLSALRSEGYYDGRVTQTVDESAQPVRVVFDVEPGPLYRFAPVDIELAPADSLFRPPAPAEIGLETGSPARSQPILDAESDLVRRAQAGGFALAQIGDRTAMVQRSTQEMDLTLRLDTGQPAKFGSVTFEGMTDVNEDFLQSRVTWQPGDPYDPEEVTEFRRKLLDTNLFTAVQIIPAETLTEQGELPFRIRVTERLHRSVGAGVRYRSDEGPGANVFWENRNLFGNGERFRVEVDGSPISQMVAGSYREPFFWREDQSLLLDAGLRNEDTDAYSSTSITVAGAIERELAENMFLTAGPRYRLASIEEKTGEEDDSYFNLLSFPVNFRWDTSDDLFDPTRGGRLDIMTQPYASLTDNAAFWRNQASYARYYQISSSPWFVLAGRVMAGTIDGADVENVPADERYYAGGGGSIRGYAFQAVGPQDDGDPEGGLSLLTGSLELRNRFTDTIGGALFVDGGTAYSDSMFQGGDEPRFGAGFGVRYITPIGPLRADLAFPVNGRDNDDAFQFYVSLGQAF